MTRVEGESSSAEPSSSGPSPAGSAGAADVFVGLGSNLGDRAARLGEAVARLSSEPVLIGAISSIYESAPVGPVQDQPPFYNAALALRTELEPRELLRRLLAIEAAMGRERLVPQGPRNIDLDLLLAGARVEAWPELVLPHPRLTERAFVLVPLLEIAPSLVDPRDGQPLAPRAEALRIAQPLVCLGPLLAGKAGAAVHSLPSIG